MIFAEVIKLKISRSFLMNWVGPKSIDKCLRRDRREDREPQRRRPREGRAGTEGCSRARSRGSWERQEFVPEPSEGTQPADILIWDFFLQNRERICVRSKPPSLW